MLISELLVWSIDELSHAFEHSGLIVKEFSIVLFIKAILKQVTIVLIILDEFSYSWLSMHLEFVDFL